MDTKQYWESVEYQEWLKLAHAKTKQKDIGYWFCEVIDGKVTWKWVNEH